jgi:DNA invertase Pin-like site-specific DNA recombinase
MSYNAEIHICKTLYSTEDTEMNIGYARVSTTDQNLELQLEALNKVACEKIFTDQVSGTTFERGGLSEALGYVRKGDCIVVWKLDRLGRSLKELLELVGKLEEMGVGFRSITEGMDTSTSGGKMIFHVFGALAQFERDLIRERTKAGLAAAKAKGRIGGRPNSIDSTKVESIDKLCESMSVTAACKQVGVSRASYYRLKSASR